MIARDAEPIGHVPPLKRIDLNARPPSSPNVVWSLTIAEGLVRWAEGERIWQLVVQAAGKGQS